ncbi:hypothetical protein BDM02DRAFT_3116114 [Thelephora ganbajun]|uniref:Uncharacterized protein n=1 Tax=Thelephora ganbajun TaxID=370292 RepID=A0ACB6ZEN7_THEGA|nr:hypothetical protein BDM02DRAFT_3116114 [Thelephora ganbajun]
MLFIANRYTPVLFLTWINVSMFSYTKSFCQKTKWILTFHPVAIAVLAQIAIALRVYGVTGRNRLVGGALLVLISAQFCLGIYFVIRAGINPMSSVPEIDLDPFKVCLFKRWPLGDILFNNFMIAFGTLSSSNLQHNLTARALMHLIPLRRGIAELLTFVIIFVTAKRRGMTRYPGVPTLLDTILRDATLYFIFMFVVQGLLEMFLFFAPVGDMRMTHSRIADRIVLIPCIY